MNDASSRARAKSGAQQISKIAKQNAAEIAILKDDLAVSRRGEALQRDRAEDLDRKVGDLEEEISVFVCFLVFLFCFSKLSAC